MGLYTITLNDIIKNNIEIPLNDYPIFDELHRTKLNQKIIDRFRFYEIGFETITIFNHELATRMNEIMPTANKKYEAQALQFNLEYAKSTNTETRDLTKNEQRDGVLATDSTSGSETLFSDTPNKNRNESLLDLALSNVSLDTTTVDSDSTSSDTAEITDAGTVTNIETRFLSADDIIKYHDYNYFNDIDLEIVNSLYDLFHMLYSI